MDVQARDSSELAIEEAKPFLSDEEEESPEQRQLVSPRDATARTSRRFWISVIINCAATAGIVFVNKRIFANTSFRHAQVAFAAFHFTVTAALLYSTSRPGINLFQAKKVDPLILLPLAFTMVLNVVLPNASLANSSIQFYQIARVLLTPLVALLNYILYGVTVPARAAWILLPVCVGVAMVSYFDTVPSGSAEDKATTPLGVAFAMAGVLASSVYAIWIKRYHELLKCSSMQLLLNQAPLSVLLMLYIIPFSDDVTVFAATPLTSWLLILVSAFLAMLINLSQFIIINEAGPVNSTVVVHFKTCLIVAMGWAVSGKPLTDASFVGVVLAVGGIIAYSIVMQMEEQK